MKKRIVFMGTPDYAKDILKTLVQNNQYDIVAVFTQPDRLVGRKKVLTSSETKIYGLKVGLKIFQPENLKEKQTFLNIQALKPDFIIVAAFGQILPKIILDIAPCINLHASILPKYRGASPIQTALLNGDKTTGVTAMLMDIGLDTGDILGFNIINIDKTTTALELFKTLTKNASKLTLSILENFENIQPIKQKDFLSSHCGKIKKEDGLIHNFDNAEKIYNKFRAFSPWPSVFTNEKLKILEMELEDTKTLNQAGKIIAIDKKSIVIGCSIGSLRIKKIQANSKKPMDIDVYLNGKHLKIGDYIL